MPLQSLPEWNAERSRIHGRCVGDQRNGIACPTCKGELVDSSPGVYLTSWPPQKNVHCPVCGWKGVAVI